MQANRLGGSEQAHQRIVDFVRYGCRHASHCRQAFSGQGAGFGLGALLQSLDQRAHSLGNPPELRVRYAGNGAAQGLRRFVPDTLNEAYELGYRSGHALADQPAQRDQKQGGQRHADQCCRQQGMPIRFEDGSIHFDEHMANYLAVLAQDGLEQQECTVAQVQAQRTCALCSNR